jgi:DME family drug/metabolite transporter
VSESLVPAPLAVLLAAVCFGTTGTALVFAPDDASPASVGAIRIVIGGAILAALLLGGRGGREVPPRIEGTRAATVALVVVGAVAIAAYQPLFFLGTSASGVAVGTIVALGSAPVLTGALEWLVRRRFPGTVWLVATAIASVGVILLSGSGSGPARADTIGLLGSLGAGASYAVYALVAKALIDRGERPSWTMGVLFGVAAIVTAPVLVGSDLSWLSDATGVAVALWLGVVTTAVAYRLFGSGLERLSASTAATLTLAEPATATLLGVLLLGESLTGAAVLGVSALVVAIVVLVIPWRRASASRGGSGAEGAGSRTRPPGWDEEES